MQQTLNALIELQELDDRLDILMEERGDLPGIVEELNKKVGGKQKTKTELEENNQQYENRQKEFGKLIEEMKTKLSKYEEQLYQVKTNREYDAMTTEIETIQQSLNEYEDEGHKLKAQIQENTAKISGIEVELASLLKDLEENKIELDARLSETADEENALRKEREKIVKNFSPQIISSYETIRQARNGKGIAPIINGNCGGCFSYIPPQKIVEVRKMKKIIECESCGRILVWNEKVN